MNSRLAKLLQASIDIIQLKSRLAEVERDRKLLEARIRILEARLARERRPRSYSSQPNPMRML